jgi:hypothetical protein
VDDPREQDELDRIKLHQDIERARAMLTQYETGMANFRKEIENWRYKLGRLDERLGVEHDRTGGPARPGAT